MLLPTNLPSFDPSFNNSDTFGKNNTQDMTLSNEYTNMLYTAHGLKDVSQNSINLERNAEVNMYYLLKYNKQIYVLKLVIFTCCVALIGVILYSNKLLSSNMFTYYLGVVFGIGAIFIIYNIYDIYIRDSYTFDEYNFQYKPPPLDASNNALASLTTSELANMSTVC